jgi:TRAP-type C4-dicarboxylate transport system permease small subunit
MGLSLPQKQNKLIKVEALRRVLSPAVLTAIQFFIQIIIFAFLLFLFVSGLQLVKINWAAVSPSLRLPISIYSVAIVVATVFMLLHYATTISMKIVKYVKDKRGR